MPTQGFTSASAPPTEFHRVEQGPATQNAAAIRTESWISASVAPFCLPGTRQDHNPRAWAARAVPSTRALIFANAVSRGVEVSSANGERAFLRARFIPIFAFRSLAGPHAVRPGAQGAQAHPAADVLGDRLTELARGDDGIDGADLDGALD